MMFKYSKYLDSMPIIHCLPEIMRFTFTITVPDNVNSFILHLAETKRSTKHLHLMALEF